MHAVMLLKVRGSLRNNTPVNMLVMGSNNPAMLVTVGPAYFMLMGINVLAKNATKNATSIVNNHPFGVIVNTRLPLIKPAINK